MSDPIDEKVNPIGVNTSNIKMNDSLNPKLFDSEGVLNEKVRKVLLKIAEKFYKFLKLNDIIKIHDVILTGSLANYNYTKYSDVDLHIILDFSRISGDTEFIKEYFKDKKKIWADSNEIKIFGFPVECYVQDSNEDLVAAGVYSLKDNAWLKKPQNKIVNIDKSLIQKKAAHIMSVIDDLENDRSKDIFKKIDKIKEQIKNMRKSGLEQGGEFSLENLVFKVLRFNGYLDKINDLENKRLTQFLSI